MNSGEPGFPRRLCPVARWYQYVRRVPSFSVLYVGKTPLRLALTMLRFPLVICARFTSWKACRLKYGRTVRLKSYAERDILALAGADEALNVRLVHIGWAAGHANSLEMFHKWVYATLVKNGQ